jgi:hypothetical protein
LLGDLVAGLVVIVFSYCARRSGERRAKRQSEAIVRTLAGPQALVVDEQEREQEVAEDATR